jgi:hypothetical protein
LSERDIERGDDCFRGAPGTVDCFGGALGTVDCLGEILGLVSFGRSFRQRSTFFSLELSTYGRDTTLEEGGDGFECDHHMGWFRIVSGGASCTLVLVYVSIRLRETVSEIRSIERFSTADTVQQLP